jgi:hypothetical protein
MTFYGGFCTNLAIPVGMEFLGTQYYIIIMIKSKMCEALNYVPDKYIVRYK